MENLRKLSSDFECTILDNGLRQPEKTWITFLHAGFEENWLPLTDWDGNDIFWSTDNMRIAKKIAHEKFGGAKFGLSPCNQKKIGNACVDNF
jgi:hypothetical protein|tara:strand:+ start:379 stop:654 length:276 start_codon:yes stop_codon:yes gene_type:complete